MSVKVCDVGTSSVLAPFGSVQRRNVDLVDHTRINVHERWRDPPAEAFRDQGTDDDQMAILIRIEVGEYEVMP